MQKNLLYLFITVLSINSYSQIKFEKGYLIDNADQRIECQIKNMDSKKNPTQFIYRLNDEGENKIGNIVNVKEFGIYNESKYFAIKVNIDRSSNTIDNLSKEKEPLFTEEKLFLKLILEGKSNLYEYVDSSIIRYFYSREDGSIDQLVYKKYLTPDDKIGINNKFRQQLYADLKCNTITISSIEKVTYYRKDLKQIFSEYSSCSGVAVADLAPKQKRDLFNLTLRPRINSSTLKISTIAPAIYNVDFGNQIGFGFGLEAEFILPFNRNKWSIAVEPTYQKFEDTKTVPSKNVSGLEFVAPINYASIDVPLSLRHYFFLTDNSKIFVNAGVVFDLSPKSNIKIMRNDKSVLETLKIEAKNNYTFGAGYKLYDKFSVEFRFQARTALADYHFYKSPYQTSSIIIGYSIF